LARFIVDVITQLDLTVRPNLEVNPRLR
jgi:hypothetical protein